MKPCFHPAPLRRLPLFATLALGCAQMAFALPKPDKGTVGETGPYDYGVMGPPGNAAIVAAAEKAIAIPMPPGPFRPTWDSIKQGYRTPTWFENDKFGIFMHWGLYSVPAHGSEWYEKHMYAAFSEWHTKAFGPPEKFGYKDFIPLWKAEKWNPDAWAELFKKSGARLVIPCAQHHDNFALWDSAVTPFNAKAMGPKRDLIGDLGAAVRRQGLKFGVSNHGVENFTFINPTPAVLDRLKAAKADLFDPKWASFYNVADRSDAAMTRFLTDWVRRNYELIDKYQPDFLWFDNGANLRLLDPLKLDIAAYYYNRATEWKKEVSISTKFVAYAPTNKDNEQIGAIIDFEKVGGRSPAAIRPGPWMVDDPIGSTWGYTTGMKVSDAGRILGKLIETTSKGGFYLLNLSPMADGTIPQAQQDTLLGIGEWLARNGEAIYDTRPWTTFGEKGADRGAPGFNFTTKGDVLYAIGSDWPKSTTVTIASLPASVGKVAKVELLGSQATVGFSQDSSGLRLSLPASPPGKYAFALKISGLKLP